MQVDPIILAIGCITCYVRLVATVLGRQRWGMMAPYGRVAEVKILRKSNSTGCGFATWRAVSLTFGRCRAVHPFFKLETKDFFGAAAQKLQVHDISWQLQQFWDLCLLWSNNSLEETERIIIGSSGPQVTYTNLGEAQNAVQALSNCRGFGRQGEVLLVVVSGWWWQYWPCPIQPV